MELIGGGRWEGSCGAEEERLAEAVGGISDGGGEIRGYDPGRDGAELGTGTDVSIWVVVVAVVVVG